MNEIWDDELVLFRLSTCTVTLRNSTTLSRKYLRRSRRAYILYLAQCTLWLLSVCVLLFNHCYIWCVLIKYKHSAIRAFQNSFLLFYFLNPNEIHHNSKHLEEFCELELRKLCIGRLKAKTFIASIYLP
jgi:hypothetical protein